MVLPHVSDGGLVSEFILFIGLIALWLAIAWLIFRRVGFFGAQKPPRFSIQVDGQLYDSRSAVYLINGIANGRHLVFVFETAAGIPFVYHSRDKNVIVLDGEAALQTYVHSHCGGEKGLAKLAEVRAKLAQNP